MNTMCRSQVFTQFLVPNVLIELTFTYRAVYKSLFFPFAPFAHMSRLVRNEEDARSFRYFNSRRAYFRSTWDTNWSQKLHRIAMVIISRCCASLKKAYVLFAFDVFLPSIEVCLKQNVIFQKQAKQVINCLELLQESWRFKGFDE